LTSCKTPSPCGDIAHLRFPSTKNKCSKTRNSRWARGLAALALSIGLTTGLPARAATKTDFTALSLEELLNLSVVGASKYEQTQREVPAAVSIITRDDILGFGWRTLDEALASLPGMHSTYDRQYAYMGMRGFGLPGDNNTRVLVMINGNRVNDSVYDGGQTDRSFPVDMGLVERIEFIPGPGGALYGQNAMLGVVNVITRDGASLAGAELAGGIQSPMGLREGRASWGRKLENGLDIVLSVSGMWAKGQDLFFDYGSSGVSGVARGLDGERNKQFFAKISRGTWSLDFESGDRRKYDPTGIYRSDPLVPGQYQGDRHLLGQAQYQDAFLDGSLQVTGRLFAGEMRYTSILEYGTSFSFPATGEWHGGELRVLYLGVTKHKLMLGLEGQDNARVDQQVLDMANPANDILIASRNSRTGIYAQDDWRVADTLTAIIGLRVDYNSATGSETSPRAGLIWEAAPTTTLKALYGRAHRAPNAFERDYDDGLAQVANPGLKGESIDTLEFVADQRVSSELQLRGTAYRWVMDGLISLGTDPVSGLPQYRSGSKVTASGVELSADKVWDWGARLRGSVSWQHVRNAADARLLNSPQLLGKLNFSAPLPVAGLRMGYELQYNSSRLTVDGSSTSGYAVSNLRLSTEKLAEGLEVGMTVRNLFDKRFFQPAADTNWQNALAQDGRSIFADVRFRF
jgi:outer membrane receptor protein involved in Fe transport